MRLLLAACLALACATAQAGEIGDLYRASGTSPKDVQKVHILPLARVDHGITEIGIERTECFGECPIYTLVVRNDGTFRYTGKANVEHLGTHKGQIPADAFDWLAQFIRDSGYMQLKDGYAREATDFPTTYTMVVMNGERKIVMDYGYAGPSSLWATEALIDRLLDGAAWN